jgi:hypothetical protein
MKYRKIPLLVILAVLGSYTSVAQASSSGEALAACKKHIAETYDGELRTSVRRIRSRASGTEIKIKVSKDGERFNAVCRVDRAGELAYTTDREMDTNAIAGAPR